MEAPVDLDKFKISETLIIIYIVYIAVNFVFQAVIYSCAFGAFYGILGALSPNLVWLYILSFCGASCVVGLSNT